MNQIDIVIEGYAKITDTGWEASGTTTLITAPVIANEVKQSGSTEEIVEQENGSPIPQGTTSHGGAQSGMTGRSDIIRIITDPGANRDLLFERLKERNLGLEDIDYVFLTHHHLDHAMNVGLFPKAKVIDEEAMYTQDKAEEGLQMIPNTDITILPTPGHEAGHGILVVPTAQGTVVVAGDNFWWTTNEEQKIDIEKPDDFAEDMEVLKESRKQVLDLADWVIPGHGIMWKVNK